MRARPAKKEAAATAAAPTEEYAFGFHEGETLVGKVATTYHGMLPVLLEMIQNALDKKARHIWVGINYKSRTAVVRDNGDGIDPEEFGRALQSVGRTIKEPGKLGQYGLGMTAGLGIAERMLITGTPKSNPRAYRTWTLDREELRRKHRIGAIPCIVRQDLFYSAKGKGKNAKPWRAEVLLERFTKDRTISALTFESFRSEVIARYGVVMRRNDVMVYLAITDEEGSRQVWDFKAPEYAGEPLPDAAIKNEQAGETRFHLFIARADKRYKSRGEVGVGKLGDDFRIPFAAFLASLPESFRAEIREAAAALQSGYFEGEILNSLITLNPDRKGFESNDRLAAFCGAIAEWFATIGRAQYAEVQEARESARLQEFGRRSLAVIDQLAHTPAGAFIQNVIGTFRKGLITPAHTRKKVEEFTSFKVLREARPELFGAKKDGGDSGTAPKKDEPGYEKPADMPFVAAGPEGRKRAIVRNNSLGLTLVHDVMLESLLWSFDTAIGILRLNIRHPLWVKCSEKGDTALMRFEEHLIVQAFMLEAAPAELREPLLRVFDQEAAAMAFMATEADTIAGRTLMGVRGSRGSRQPREKKPAKSLAIK